MGEAKEGQRFPDARDGRGENKEKSGECRLQGKESNATNRAGIRANLDRKEEPSGLPGRRPVQRTGVAVSR